MTSSSSGVLESSRMRFKMFGFIKKLFEKQEDPEYCSDSAPIAPITHG